MESKRLGFRGLGFGVQGLGDMEYELHRVIWGYIGHREDGAS